MREKPSPVCSGESARRRNPGNICAKPSGNCKVGPNVWEVNMAGTLSASDLCQLNLEITNAENNANTAFFEALLAPAFAFRRANGVVVDRQGFLDALKAGGDRQTEAESIEIKLLGKSRALVECVVFAGTPDQRRRFENARLFSRDENGNWRLLSWANESI
jgi:hypothetical protein